MGDLNLAELETLVASLRRIGVRRIKCGTTELDLGPVETEPQASEVPRPLTEEQRTDALRSQIREDLDLLYASSGVPVTDRDIDRELARRARK